MKIGIITITRGYNYGNKLQNYAVQKVLESLGHNAETIINDPYNKNNKFTKTIKFILAKLYNVSGLSKIKKLNSFLRTIEFESFSKKYIKSSKYAISINNIPTEINNDYDFFVCGSDQIWNPHIEATSEIDFLSFATSGKKIAYAASFGVSNIPLERQPEYKKLINEIDYLSVREEDGAKIIKELTGRHSEVVIDPTLMLDKSEWIKISKKPNLKINKNYILLYFLGEISKKTMESIIEISKNNDLEIINLLDKNNKNIYKIAPDEFIYLISNCKLVFTDSFHAIIFSIIMEKPFVICERLDSNISMNSRISTLVNLFKIENRIEKNINFKEIFDADYNNVNKIITRERKKVIDYLNNAFK